MGTPAGAEFVVAFPLCTTLNERIWSKGSGELRRGLVVESTMWSAVIVIEPPAIDERFVPTGFGVKIPKVRVELFDRSKRDLKKAEMCIRIDRFERKKDGSIEVLTPSNSQKEASR